MQYTLVGNEDGTANLTVFVEGGAPLCAHSTHPSYDAILAGVFSGDESVYSLFDIAKTAGTKFERLSDRITSAQGRLYLDGEEIHDVLAEQVTRFIEEGVEDWRPLVAFYENLQANPNEHSREQLYRWLAAEDFTITEDGLIIGYKGVSARDVEDDDVDYPFQSTFSGQAIVDGTVYEGYIPNGVGSVVEMQRGEVHHDPSADCSVGLHVGTHAYALQYGSVRLEVAVNPRDVVSVPTDAGGQKMRVCRYTVVKVLDQDEKIETVVKPESKTEKAKRIAGKVVGKKLDVRVGDVYEDTDKRRAGRTFKVETLLYGGYQVEGKSLPNNIRRTITIERLQSRKYKLVKRGKKS